MRSPRFGHIPRQAHELVAGGVRPHQCARPRDLSRAPPPSSRRGVASREPDIWSDFDYLGQRSFDLFQAGRLLPTRRHNCDF